MPRFRYVAAVAIAAAASLVLAGCSGSGGGDAKAGSVKPATSGTVSWWGWTPDTPVAQKYIEEFNKEYPNIKVTYKNFENVDFRNAIAPALDSGKGPDIFDLSAAGGSPDTYGPYALDLSDFAKSTLGADWTSKFAGNWADQLKSTDGRQVALPLGGQAAGILWYDQDILTAAGISAPPTDYQSWVDDCKKITAIGKICFAMGAGGTDTFPTDFYHSIANSVDPSYFLNAAEGKAKWNDPQGVQVLQIIKQMKDDGIISKNVLDDGQYPLADGEFMSGKAAFVQMGYWYTQYSGAASSQAAMSAAGVKNPKSFVQLPAAFPDVAGQGKGSQLFGEVDYGLAINADSPNIGAAETFIKWITMTQTGQQDVANALDLLPGLQGVKPDWANITLVNNTVQQPAIEKLISDSGATTQTRQWQTTSDTLNAMVVAIQQVLDPSSGKSVQQAADGLQAAAKASTVGVK